MDEQPPEPAPDRAPGQPQRRRRRRATARQGPPPAAPAADPQRPPPQQAAAPTRKDERRKPRRRAPDQQARGAGPRADLAGAVRSQVGISGALRARDVNRPTDEDLAAAEAELVVIRRNWRPDDGAGPPRRRP